MSGWGRWMITGAGSPFQGSVNRYGCSSQGDALGFRRTHRWGWGSFALGVRMGVLVLLLVLEPMGSWDGVEGGAGHVGSSTSTALRAEYQYEYGRAGRRSEVGKGEEDRDGCAFGG